MKFNKRQHSGIFPLGMLLPEMWHQIAFQGDENLLYLDSEWQLHGYTYM